MATLSGSMQTPRTSIVRVGAIAAILFAAGLAAVVIGYTTMSSVSEITDEATATQFLNDVAPHKDLMVFVVWMEGLTALLLVPFAIGIHEGLRRWNSDLMRVAEVAFAGTAVLLAIAVSLDAALASYVVPTWSGTSDAAVQARLTSIAPVFSAAGNAMSSMSNFTVGIGLLASSITMLQANRRWWQVLGWIGIVGGIASVLATFIVLSSAFEIAAGVGGAVVFIWLIGTCVGLWQMTTSPATAEMTATEATAMNAG